MEIHGHIVAADETCNVCLSGAFEVETEVVCASLSNPSADRIEIPGLPRLEEESMVMNTKKRAFDADSKDLRSPTKKLAVRSSPSEALVDSDQFSGPLAEAMIIDTTWEEAGEKESDTQQMPSSPKQISSSVPSCTRLVDPFLEAGIHVNSGAPEICETAPGALISQKFADTSVSVASHVNITESKGDLIALNSVELEFEVMESINVVDDSLGLMKVEDGVVEEEDTPILENDPRNAHATLKADVPALNANEIVEEGSVVRADTEISVPNTAADGGLLHASPSRVDPEKANGELHVASASHASMDDVSASEVRSNPLSFDSSTALGCQLIRESDFANDATRCDTAADAGVDDTNGSTEVDELEMEKADAAEALELRMVEVIMQSPDFEIAESGNGGTMNPLSDDPLTIRDHEEVDSATDLIGLSDEAKLADLFEPVVQLPEHPEGTNGFLPGTPDSEGLMNGHASDDLRVQHEMPACQPLLNRQDPLRAHVDPDKDLDYPELSGSDRGVDSMDMQYSEVLTPSVAASAPVQSSGLQLPLKMTGPGEIAAKVFSNSAAGRCIPEKEIILKEAPGSAKLLLASGLLDGHYVRYLGRGGHVMLTGIIQEGGVLCDCSACKGVQVVNVSAFEKHAGSSARHPSDFIFLENGKCLKDILETGWHANKRKLNVMDVLKSAIGEIGGENVKIRSQEYPMILNQSVAKKPRLFPDPNPRTPVDRRAGSAQDMKPGSPQEVKPKLPAEMKPRLVQDTKPRLSHDLKPRSTIDVKAKGSEGRATQPRERTVREKESSSPPVVSRDASGANSHKALFLPGGLEDGTELGYYVKGQNFLSGVKRGSGILCSCCQQLISCSLFEQHAGWGSRRNPYTSIYLADGRSLHDAAQSLVVEQTVKQEGISPAKIEHLDQCVECGDTGDLLLCTGCPNACHQDCLGVSDSSTGEFVCVSCQEERFGGTKDRRRTLSKRRSRGSAKTLLTRDHVTGRSSRLLQVPEKAVVLGGCVFCKSGDFAKSGFGPMTTLLCDQCEREFHVGCLKQHCLEDLKELPDGEWFCGQDCKHIHSILSLLVSNGPEPLADSIISRALRKQPRLDGSEAAADSDIATFEWQLLHGRGGDPSNGKTLAEAVQIFSECFDPIADGRSGGDLIPLMVYRRSIRDQDFGGIYCVVLKQDNKVVSTALIRVFGRQLAELPLLATNPSHQGQGHCKALLLSIERLLGVLRVQRLALPAAEGAEGIWLNKFGFGRMLGDQVQQFHANLNMMIFTGSSMLEKAIPPLEIIRQ